MNRHVKKVRSPEGLSEHSRICSAYVKMAKCGYRPGAPGNGRGGILLTEDQLKDQSILDKEASSYATRFLEEENSRTFWIGVSNWKSNRAFVHAIEACRLMSGAQEHFAIKLLQLSINELKRNL